MHKSYKNYETVIEKDLGNFKMFNCLKDGEYPPHVKLVCEVEIQPGKACREHSHLEDYEIFYFLSGKGTYLDNDKIYQVESGDITICPIGSSHAIKPIGDKPIKFLAIITEV